MGFEDPLYGTVDFEGAPARVIEHPAIQRLKRVHQNGGLFLINPEMDTSRFEHTLGVAALCKRFGAGEREVIAALVHDVGHTAFSHVADHVLDRADQAFHEDSVGKVVKEYELDEYLADLGFDPETVLDPDGFSILEQELPDLCADRLDYQLRDVFKYGLIDRSAVDAILARVTVADGQLVAANRETAHKLVDLSLLLQRQVYFKKRHEGVNLVLTDLLEQALKTDSLTVDDLFQTDQEILETLRTKTEYSETLAAIDRNLTINRVSSQTPYTITRKRRTMDPRVAGTDQRISELDPTAARKLTAFRENVPMQQRYAITLTT